MPSDRPLAAKRRLLLVAWDSADWTTLSPLLQSGALPNLAQLIARGAAGELQTAYPVSMPIVWTSAMTGVSPAQHGVLGYATTSLSAERQGRLVTPADRRVPALWDFVARHGDRSHVVNFPCTHPIYSTGGVSVSDAVTRGLVADDVTGAVPPTGWLCAPELQGGTDWVGLRMAAGEVEHSMLAKFAYSPGPFPDWLAPAVAGCCTVHNFTTAALESNVDWTLSAFRYPCLLPLAIARARGGSDPTNDQAAIKGLYRLHDLFLGRLLQIATKTAEEKYRTSIMLVSGHGFPARMVGGETDVRAGMIIVAGAGVPPRASRLLAAELLDVAPTALNLLGFETSVWENSGMDGRVLTGREDKAIVSSCGATPEGLAVKTRIATLSLPWQCEPPAPVGTTATLASLAVEGLLPFDQVSGDHDAARSVYLSELWTLARALAFVGSAVEALPLLEALHANVPERVDVTILLANTLRETGRRSEATEIISELLREQAAGNAEVSAKCHYYLAEESREFGEVRDAQQHLTKASKLTRSPALLLGIGRAFYNLRRFQEAESCFIRVLDVDPTEPAAWMGRAGMAILTRRFEEAIAYAQQALALRHDVALTHLILARSLRLANRQSEARASYVTARRLGIHARRSTKRDEMSFLEGLR